MVRSLAHLEIGVIQLVYFAYTPNQFSNQPKTDQPAASEKRKPATEEEDESGNRCRPTGPPAKGERSDYRREAAGNRDQAFLDHGA
jgi:hypothetical protein